MPDYCTLVAKPHPFDCDTVYAETLAGQTIAQMLGDGVSQTCGVSVDGENVPQALWAKVKPKAGHTIHVVMYPQGGDSNKMIRMVAMAVLMYYTMGAGGGWADAATGSQYGLFAGGSAVALQGGAYLLGMMAINALIPPPTPKGMDASDPFDQGNSFTGTSNQAHPYGVIPCVVGQTRFFPPHAALPYTEIIGNDQYMRMLLDLGYGDLDASDITIGETPLTSYEGVEWEIGTNPSLFTQDIFELQVGLPLVNQSDFADRTTQGAVSEISLDVVFPQGLFGKDAHGKTVAGTVFFTVWYKAAGTSTWFDAPRADGATANGNWEITEGFNMLATSSEMKALRMGLRWKVPLGQYDVRVERDGTTFAGALAEARVSGAAFSVLRSISPQLPSTTGTTKLALRIKATDQLNGVVSTLSLKVAQKVRRWDTATSTWLTPVATQNPAWIYLWLMTECKAVKRRLTDDRMDIAGIANWAAECEAKGYKIGFVMDAARAFGDVIRDVLAAGRASFGLRNSLYSAVRDIAQTVPVQMFTPANSWGFSYSRSFADLPHALRVSFTNPEASNQEDEVLVYADGYTEATATRFETLDLRIVTAPDAAWRLGMYHLAVMYNRPNQYTWQADIEHMVCERGDLVHVAHDITGWGVAQGRIKAISGSTVTLDGPVTLEAGKTYALRIRLADDTQITETITSAAGDVQTLTLAAPLAVGDVGDLFVIGEVNRGVAPLIVRKIEPGDDLTATITAVDYAPAVLTADSGTPPPFTSNITGKPWCAPPLPPVVHIRAGYSVTNDAGAVHAEPGVSGAPTPGIHRIPIRGHTGGGGCPTVDTLVRRVRDGVTETVRAGDIAVGDVLEGADPLTLEPMTHVVTYSQTKLQPCVQIYTASGRVLLCSITAPIPTPGGLVKAPDVAGRRIAIRDDDAARWDAVTSMRGIGLREVQHISIDDGCFWAGDVLHHNKQNSNRNFS